MIAALFVETKGAYAGLEGVDLWDQVRDARLYAGPWPVVAHPPCSRWCQLAGLVEARWGHKKGDDGGCFEAALHAVRTYGGVLEHPAYSRAWDHFGLLKPEPSGWTHSLFDPGVTAHVEQFHYGHRARKATWLYAVGADLPVMRWGRCSLWEPTATFGVRAHRSPPAVVSYCRNHRDRKDPRPELHKKERKATPLEFRDVLLGIAASVATLAP